MFSKPKYLKAREEYKGLWSRADRILYDLCRRRPTQKNIYAKALIIGRTYQTGIERMIRSEGIQGSSMGKLCRYLCRKHIQHQSRDILGGLPRGDKLTRENLGAIIDAHGRFVRLIKTAIREGQCVRSFAAKYMHFHRPIVPIFDSIVENTIRSIVRWSPRLVEIDLGRSADKTYWKYVHRFLELCQLAHNKGVRPTVRLLDYYLLYVARRTA